MTSKYPSATLINKRFLIRCTLSVLVVYFGFVLSMYIIGCYPEYLPPEQTGVYLGNENLARNTAFMLNYICFVYDNIILVVYGIIVNEGKPFRKTWY